MKLMRLIGVLICLGSLVCAEDLHREHLWTGINGKIFRGTFHRFSPDGTGVEVLSNEGKIITVAIANLIQADRDLILKHNNPDLSSAASPAGKAEAFKPAGSPDRSLMPDLDPKQFNCSTDEAMVDALWISLLWWNKTGVLEIPKKGDFERKAEWLHKLLTRLVAAGGRSSASLDDAKEGVEKYFVDEMKELAACRTFVETKDFSAARLARFTQGPNAVILKMTMTYANGRDFSISAVLESIQDDGRFTLHVFGKRFTGQIKPIEKENGRQSGTIPVEYVLDGAQAIPAYYAQNGAKIFMGNRPWNGVMVLKPYVYHTPGKPSPLPLDDEFAPAKEAPLSQGVTPDPVFNPKFPMQFTSSLEVSREWSLVGGRKFQGCPVVGKAGATLLTNATGQQIEVTETDFLDEDRAKFEFWKASLGIPQSPPRMDLTYRLTTSHRGSFEVKILTEGLLGRVEFPSDRSTLVFDMKDGAFVVTRFHQSNGNERTITSTGRFLPEHLLPREIQHRHTQEDLNRLLDNTLPASRKSENKTVPARYLRYPFQVSLKEFRDPEIDFVLIEQPTVLAGLFQLLCMQTAGDGGHQPFFFSHYNDIPPNNGCREVFPILAACRMMPAGIKWVNAPGNYTSAEDVLKHAGRFSIELIRAAIPDAFPKGLFDIPLEARAAPVGSCRTSQ
jgi:hypothetical protein